MLKGFVLIKDLLRSFQDEYAPKWNSEEESIFKKNPNLVGGWGWRHEPPPKFRGRTWIWA